MRRNQKLTLVAGLVFTAACCFLAGCLFFKVGLFPDRIDADCLFAAAGAIVFAKAESLGGLVLGRALIGIARGWRPAAPGSRCSPSTDSSCR